MLAEEVTAFAAGDAAAAAMTERFALVAEFRAAQAELTSATHAWNASNGAVTAAHQAGAAAPYAAKVDAWNAYTRWREAMDEAMSTERALANATAGKAP